MTFTEAAEQVLRLVGRPLHYKEITAHAIEKDLLSHVGKTPETTMGTRLAALFRKDPENNPLIRVRPGVFALKQWADSGELEEMIGNKPKPQAKTVTAPPAHVIAEQKAEEERRAKEAAEAKAARAKRSKAAKNQDQEQAEEVEAKPPVKRAPRAATKAKKTSSTRSRSTKRTTKKNVEASSEEIKAAPESKQADPAEAAPVDAKPSSDDAPPAETSSRRPAKKTIAPAKAKKEQDASDTLAKAPDVASPESPADPPASSVASAATEAEAAEAKPASAEDATIARLAREAKSVFVEEDDDNQPIMAVKPEPTETRRQEQQQAQSQQSSSSSRRRRRRRRPKNGQDNQSSSPVAYSATPASAGRGASESGSARSSGNGQHAVVLDLGNNNHLDKGFFDDLGGRDMADVIAGLLDSTHGTGGAVSLRQLAEKAQERSRHGQDSQLLQSQLAAAIRADNLRRSAHGDRPRFRFVGGRVSLTDWNLSKDLLRLEREAMEAVKRYREASRVAFSRKVQELPGHAFVELSLMVFESLGFRNLRSVRRAGIPGNESHYTGLYDVGVGRVRVAIVIRRDNREVGRERVSEFRGALHHYGPAALGWLVTSGAILSGAREEAASPNAEPIMLLDAVSIARLCEQHGIAVTQSTLPISIPDLDVLEALRAT